jgi:DNA adenine methylase
MTYTQKSLKTCLRYPGGKSRACTKLDQFIPDLSNYKEYREPFLGGGSVALYLTKKYPDLNIWVNDLYEHLYNFWVQLRDNGIEMRNELSQLKQRYPDPVSARKLFEQAKEYLNEKDNEPVLSAVSFYVVNKCSFSGLTESSSFSSAASESNFSMRGIEKLPEYSKLIKNWKITNLSYEEMLDGDSNIFVYLDPPYDIKDNLYGKKGSMHKGFDHDKFASDCNVNKEQPMLISYNSDQLVRDRFVDWTAAEFSHTYTMRSVGSYNKDQHDRKELVLLNYEV